MCLQRYLGTSVLAPWREAKCLQRYPRVTACLMEEKYRTTSSRFNWQNQVELWAD